jgi:hypothetical protein
VNLPRRYWLILLALGIALLFAFMLVVTGARASACYSISDMDKRLACLAEERRDPDGCTSIRDWDDRERCRQRARDRDLFERRRGDGRAN